jgi:hypothetical protein
MDSGTQRALLSTFFLVGMKKIMKMSVRIASHGHFEYKSGVLLAHLLHRTVIVVLVWSCLLAKEC